MLERPNARRNWGLLILAALLLWFMWTVRSALNPLIVALLLAYILHPLVLKLERRGWSRPLAVNVIFGVAALGALVLGFALALQARSLWHDVVVERKSFEHIRDQVDGLVRSGSTWLEKLGVDLSPSKPSAIESEPTPPVDGVAPVEGAVVADGAQEAEGAQEADGAQELDGAQEREGATRGLLDELYDRVLGWISNTETREGLTKAGARAVGGIWAVIGGVFGSLMAGLGILFLVPLYTWFLLFELEHISSFVRSYIPPHQRARWTRIGDQMTNMLGGFFRGRLLVSLLKGVLLAIALAVCGVPYWLLLGMLAGALSLIPFVGAGIGYGLAFLLALLEFDAGGAALRIGIVFVVGEVAEGYILMPKILGGELGLPPLVVLASMMIFGSAFGMFGLLLALPITAAIVILARELVLPALRQWSEDSAPGNRRV